MSCCGMLLPSWRPSHVDKLDADLLMSFFCFTLLCRSTMASSRCHTAGLIVVAAHLPLILVGLMLYCCRCPHLSSFNVVFIIQHPQIVRLPRSDRAASISCFLPGMLTTSVFGHCNPGYRKPCVMVFGVLGWCPVWGREEGPSPLAGRSGPRSPVGPVSTMQNISTP